MLLLRGCYYVNKWIRPNNNYRITPVSICSHSSIRNSNEESPGEGSSGPSGACGTTYESRWSPFADKDCVGFSYPMSTLSSTNSAGSAICYRDGGGYNSQPLTAHVEVTLHTDSEEDDGESNLERRLFGDSPTDTTRSGSENGATTPIVHTMLSSKETKATRLTGRKRRTRVKKRSVAGISALPKNRAPLARSTSFASSMVTVSVVEYEASDDLPPEIPAITSSLLRSSNRRYGRYFARFFPCLSSGDNTDSTLGCSIGRAKAMEIVVGKLTTFLGESTEKPLKDLVECHKEIMGEIFEHSSKMLAEMSSAALECARKFDWSLCDSSETKDKVAVAESIGRSLFDDEYKADLCERFRSIVRGSYTSRTNEILTLTRSSMLSYCKEKYSRRALSINAEAHFPLIECIFRSIYGGGAFEFLFKVSVSSKGICSRSIEIKEVRIALCYGEHRVA
ncbi:hypothetical protein [Candidatus Ichthyocystis sparus]|uniref:hypothetical protein n=1 Tax=Candidatus Ichthyocystis sparus TaxID=1561004 RepID=UPI001147274A|nr:hypothetical protein [Candidatus Ichthyocystis sparus]